MDSAHNVTPIRRLDKINDVCHQGNYWVIDADIQSYFDTINHEKLMKLVEMRVATAG